MKSIKKKAEEYAKMKHTNKNLTEIVSWDFETGVNYVLECIEKVMPSSDDVLENHTKCKSAIFRLQTIIEQLKK